MFPPHLQITNSEVRIVKDSYALWLEATCSIVQLALNLIVAHVLWFEMELNLILLRFICLLYVW
jgi:hypothetical protein